MAAMRPRAWWVVVVLACAALAMGCQRAPDPQNGHGGGDRALVQQFEAFAAVHLPADARDIDIELTQNAAGEPVYRARFTTTEERARSFCRDGGFSGALLNSKGLDKQTRDRFQVQGDSAATPFGCKASNPDDRRVQRDVLVTLPSAGAAVVHLIAFRTPVR